MITDWREFHLVKQGKTHVWRIRQTNEEYVTEHGQMGGKFQTFTDKPGDKGKVGTKAYVDPIANTTFHVSREIREKTECGYREFVNGQLVGNVATSIDFNVQLPKNFCSYKPKTSIEPSALKKLDDKHQILYTRKLDGQCHLAVHHTDGWKFYSRRMDLVTSLPKQVEELSTFKQFGIGTILVGELVCVENNKEDFKKISRFCRSLPDEARKLVEDLEVPEPIFYVFDMLFSNSLSLKNASYEARMSYWFDEIKNDQTKYIKHIPMVHTTPETWQGMAKMHNWEGFVAVDRNAVPGDKFYSFDGDAKRPNGSWKLKPVWTEEVAVIAGSVGSGKRLDGIGAVHVAQKLPDSKKWAYLGKVGSGFTEDDLKQITDIFIDKDIPIFEKDKEVDTLDLDNCNKFTIEIEYSERQPGTNKFRFPVYMRIRNDKAPEECFAQRLAVGEDDE